MVGVPISPGKQKFLDVFLEYCQARILPNVAALHLQLLYLSFSETEFLYAFTLKKRYKNLWSYFSHFQRWEQVGSSGYFTAFLKLLQFFLARISQKSHNNGQKNFRPAAKWHLQILQRSSTPQAGFLAFAWGRPVGNGWKTGGPVNDLVGGWVSTNPFWNMMRKSKKWRNLPQLGVEIRKIWNHHLDTYCFNKCFFLVGWTHLKT